MELAKLPPPSPAVAAMTNSTHTGGLSAKSTSVVATVGMSSSRAEITVQLRPPKTGTVKL